MDATGSGDPVPKGGSCSATDNFLEIFDRQHLRSSGGLFDLVRSGGGNTSMEAQPQVSVLPMSPPRFLREQLHESPSEQEMATWLYPIVRGEDLVADHLGGNGDTTVGLIPVRHEQVWAKEQLTEKVKTSNISVRRKTSAGTRARKSDYSETHSLTEKRRRCKVNERFKILRQLVPGCVECNQSSTLDRTIQYMKSLQQQLQSMSSVAGCRMIPGAALYPVVPLPPPGSGDVDPPRMVPFARTPMLLPLVDHAAVVTPPNTSPEDGKSRNLQSKKSRSLPHKDD